jgi:asparagine synthase (glutamine-hydrolysing)
LLEQLYPYLEHSPTARKALGRSFFATGLDQVDTPWFAHMTRLNVTRRIFQFFREEWRERLLAWDPLDSLTAMVPDGFAAWRPLERDQYVEANTLMSGYLLSSQGDRVAMAASIEGRYPFLDHRVLEFAARLPPRLKLDGLTEKVLLRNAMAQSLPSSIIRRTKQPFRAPDSSSFFVDGEPLGYVRDLLTAESLDDAGLFDPVAVGRLTEKCRSGKAIGFGDNIAFVGVLSTMLLHAQYIRPAGGPLAPA